MPESAASGEWRIVNALLAVAIFVIPLAGWWYLPALPAIGPDLEAISNGSHFPSSPLVFAKRPLDQPSNPPPWITNVQIADLNEDGFADILACDARWNQVICYYQVERMQWRREVLADNLIAPAHATVIDIDHDGDSDVVVSVLGSIWPNDDVIGRVVCLERKESGYQPKVLLDDVRRVADVQPGDFDGDGDLDLAVAVFGYARGEILWLEQHPGLHFEPHSLFVAPGTIHVPVADFDGDGDLDIAAVVSQDDEEVWGFENVGQGDFRARRLFGSLNDELGSAGLVLSDLDQDGDSDLLLPVGDNLEDLYSYPQPQHGCLWLENLGGWKFEERRIASLGGTYAAAVGDLNNDKYHDVVLVSMFNDWDHPGHASIVWLQNDGRQQFKTWQIDDNPQHLVTAAVGDLDGDGQPEIVAGSMQLSAPFTSNSGVTIWMNRQEGSP